MTTDKARTNGLRAFYRGLKISANPHTGACGQAWRQGWLAGEAGTPAPAGDNEPVTVTTKRGGGRHAAQGQNNQRVFPTEGTRTWR